MKKELDKNVNFSNEQIYLRDILLLLAKQIKLILATTSFFFITSIIYILFFTNNIYTSKSKIMSSSSSSSGNQAVGLAAQFGINIQTNQSETKWVYPEVLKSRTIARSVLKNIFDTKRYGKNKPLIQILTYGNGQPIFGEDTVEVQAINKLISMINVIENIKTGIFTVEINSFEPELSKNINSALIDALDSHQKNYSKSKITATRIFIEQRIKSTEKELMIAEENLKVFRDQNRNMENSPALLLEQQRLIREVTVLTSVFTTLKQKFETTKIEEVKDLDYVVVLDPPEAPLRPSKPKKALIVFVFLFSGFGLSIIIGIYREYLKNNEEERIKIYKAKNLLITNLKQLLKFRNTAI